MSDEQSHGGSRMGASTLMNAQNCDAKVGMSWIYGLKPAVEPPDRLRGALVHAGIAHHYASRMAPERRPTWAREKTAEQEFLELGRGEPGLIEEARQATAAFVRWANAITDPWIPLAVEHAFSATVKELDPAGTGPEDNVLVQAKIDLLPMVVTGGLLAPSTTTKVVDHKSTIAKDRSGRLWSWSTNGNRYKTSLASSLYFKVAQIDVPRTLGVPAPDEFMIQRILTAPPFDVDRNSLQLSEPVVQHEIGPAARQLVRRHLDIIDRYMNGQPLQRSYSGCFGCDFMPICHAPTVAERNRVIRTEFVTDFKEPRLDVPRRPLPVLASS